MGLDQKGVVLDRVGRIAFLQLSCASTLWNGELCLDVGAYERIYIREAHEEGPREGFMCARAARPGRSISRTPRSPERCGARSASTASASAALGLLGHVERRRVVDRGGCFGGRCAGCLVGGA